ncbi:hypothetical protein LCGC14_1134510 [marine sediment metagenome]|uniref:Uncharacterized protein n=1 Tax=marine sediment metagenome TaxID=412755 RepID=A0A0F9GRP1_9ZZZZ
MTEYSYTGHLLVNTAVDAASIAQGGAPTYRALASSLKEEVKA